MEILEHHEKIHEAGHGHHAAQGAFKSTKRIAILISLLAALLAIAEMGGKSAQNASVIANIEASNLWASFRPSRSA